MAMTPDGRAVVAWLRESRQGYLVQARRITTAGTYGPVAPISSRGDFDVLEATIDDSGTALFAWRGGGAHQRIQAATLPPPTGYDRAP
jgi:hypothetical protein